MSRIKLVLLLIFTFIPLFIGEDSPAKDSDHPAQEARKFDEYSDAASNDMKHRLDAYAIELNNEPGAQGYIIAYGGRRCPNRGEAHANVARNYLTNYRQIDRGRVTVINGGRRSDARLYTLELWVVSSGATNPTPSPTLGRCR